MRRFFTLVLVFFLGVVIGAAFFTEEQGSAPADATAAESLVRAFSSVYGTTRETASALAAEVRPLIGQLREMDDASLQAFFRSLATRYNLPELSQGQLDGLVKLIRSLTLSGGDDLSSAEQADGQGIAGRASDAVSGGKKIFSALSRIVRVTTQLARSLMGAFGGS